ncbi:hypothetical protein JCM10213_008185 [Rhodosporidiobolus nylandii]
MCTTQSAQATDSDALHLPILPADLHPLILEQPVEPISLRQPSAHLYSTTTALMGVCGSATAEGAGPGLALDFHAATPAALVCRSSSSTFTTLPARKQDASQFPSSSAPQIRRKGEKGKRQGVQAEEATANLTRLGAEQRLWVAK